MIKTSSDLLNDTLNLVQLARETALARGNTAQAERLTPVANNLRTIASTARQGKPPAPSMGLMSQPDFQTMLSALQTPAQASQPSSSTERNQVILAMAAGGMADMDIARYMGMTRDEVHLFLNAGATSASRSVTTQV